MITLTVIIGNGLNTDLQKAVYMANDKKWCAKNALFTVDGISFFPCYDISNKPFVFAVNNSRTSNKVIYRVEDDTVIESSMSNYSFRKFKRGLHTNRNLIIGEAKEVRACA